MKSRELVLHAAIRRFFSLLVVLIVAAALMSAIGCSTALHVSHRTVAAATKPIDVPGIPFYVKRARCRQEIVWFEPIYTLTLAALLPDKDAALQSHPRGTVVLSRSNFTSDDVTSMMKLLNNKPTNEATVMAQWQKIAARSDSQVLARDFGSLSAADRVLVGRSAAAATYVDYAEQYYVNAKVPLAGSANVDAKVADDGSLSEASGQVQSKTFETIVGALPISSVITGGLGLGGKAIAPAGEIEAYQLTVSISGYRHTLAKFTDFPTAASPCPVATDISLTEANEYKREDASAVSDASKGDKGDSSAKKKTDGKDDKNNDTEKNQ